MIIPPGFEKMEFADRLRLAIFQRGTGQNLIKNLAEIIKNSDDSYHELQQQKIETTGVIEVGFWKHIKNKKYWIDEFFIRDYGVGMSSEEARKAFGKRGYGEDTSASRRNGAIGVGGKDALYGMKDVDIITIKNRIPTLIQILFDEAGFPYTKITEDKNFVTNVMSKLSNKIKNHCKPLNLNEDGTFVKFTLPKNRTGKLQKDLQNQLRLYYTLRNITNGKNGTKLRLIDVETGDIWRLEAEEPESEILQKPEPFQIPFVNKKGDQEHYQVDVIIRKAKDEIPLEGHEKELGYGFLIETDQGGILDNQMFGFEGDPGANKIFGTIIIHNWKSLHRQDPTIMQDNREALVWSHQFNKEIANRMKQFLTPIIEKERNKIPPNPDADKKLQQNMKETLAFLNKLMKADEFEDEDDPKIPPEIMDFSPSKMKIIPGKTKSIKLFINPHKIPKLTGISTEAITEPPKDRGVSIHPLGIVKTPDQYHWEDLHEIPYINFEVTGDVEGSITHLKAYYQEHQSEVTISVVKEEDMYPDNGFAFVPPTAKFVKGREKKLKLIIDTHIFPPTSIIELESEDDRVSLSYSRISVSEPNIGKYLSEEFLTVKCDNSRIKTSIIAKAKTTTGEERIAICKIKVTEKEEPKLFFKEVKIERAGESRKRARFDEGIIWLHAMHPVLRYYFGDNQERIISNPTPQSTTIVADTVLDIALREWAKKRIEEGKVPVIDERRRDEEIAVEKDRLEHKHGKEIHQYASRISFK